MSRFNRRKLAALGVAGLIAFGFALAEAPAGNAATTAPDCGATVRKADGTAWRCSFADYFDGTKLSTARWKVVTSNDADYRSRKDCFVNSSKNVSVSGGILRLTTRRTAPFSCGTGMNKYTATGTSGMVSTMGRFFQTYGRFEMKAKWPYTKQIGLQGAFWLWPEGASGMTWPVSGELDIAEWFSKYPDRAIPYLHTASSILNPSGATNNYCILKNPADWHTYTLTWTKSRILIQYDGKTCLDAGGGSPYDKPFNVSLTQAWGVKKNAPTTSTPFPSTMQVSYVRVWK
ncbi:glycoside hydrolase family 16 protein [Nocardioides marmorisolisilvae]|uniref:Glycoside hydrolase family 16 protein n=1 Tax=Nocardioides marmorisolisilvae TaxID=1542737 RepID=A0A3N0DWD4_9ACTN|nr:glycoside hydrolase family 16 protein [Nocardioides marmorisolisilvae]RNL79905.1 glycoside hydrolase family 16 protein [Nocardioides marmorisolisilvae]